ncbi:hypothetical protein BJ085DRAFT_31898 [Dimargaris cristalligena]|uniref:Uncharacterized protein n=1 Tax=Dimargaris cristalligena TaxID=215637 RepID=A0A4P9ZNW1_9FUNG|nr:hypothetical protein BJ085DRAFT_31898 [Dimargaris cristalligena]|eukprot:RKP34311.1 hypothetical protein BJ085DRAFT_31898 [Dimargaris cristalligena]
MGPIVPAPAAHIGRRRPRKPIQPRKSLSATSNRPVLPHILVPSFADLNIADNRHAGSSLSPRHPRDDRLARPSRPATITPHSPTSTSMPKSDSPGSPVSGSAPASTNQAMTLTPLDTPTESRWSPPSPTSGTSQDRNTEAGVGVNRAHHLSTESLSATAVPSRAVSPGSTWGAVVGPSLGISIRYFPQKGTIFTKYAEDPQQDRQRISTDVYEQYRIDPQALWLWSVIDPRSGPLYGTGYSLPHMSLSSSKRASASATGGHVSAQRRMGGGGSARGDNGSIPASDSDSVTGGGSGSSRTRKSHKRRDGSSNPAATPNSAKRFKRDQGLGSAKSGAAEGSPQMRRRTGAGDDQLATGEAIPSSPSLNNKRSLKSLNGAFEVMDLDLSSGPATGATSSAVSTHGDSTGPRGPTARASSRASTPVIGSDGEGSEYSVNDVSQHGYSTRRQQQIYYNALTHSAQAYEDSFKPASEISTRGKW